MITGLFERFLKKLAGCKSFSLKITTTILLSIIGSAMAFPAMAVLTIESATWDGRKLVVEGTDGRGGVVEVFYGYDTPPNSDSLGTATVKGSGSWKLQVNSNRNNPLDPVPCAVSATLAGDPPVLNFPVEGADPNTCAPQPPVAQNCTISVDPPALAFGPVQINTTSNLSTTVSNAGGADCNVTIEQTGSTDFLVTPTTPAAFTLIPGASQIVDVAYTPLAVEDDTGNLAVSSNDPITPNVDVALSGNGVDNQGNTPPTAVDQTFPIDTAVLDRAGPDGILGNAEVPAPGVLLNATDPDGDPLTAVLVGNVTAGTLVLNQDGSFEYTPGTGITADSFTYVANDGQADSGIQTVSLTVQTGLQVNTTNQNQFNILLNYELGMHCTGFEFAYCCVLPPYNSIIGQVVRTDKGNNDSDFPMLLEGDPNVGLDGLGRETVLREPQLDGDGNFNKYVMKYWHEAQPRNDGRGKPQSSILISAMETNSLFMWNTIYDAADVDPVTNALVTGDYQGASGVVLGDGDYNDSNDNYGSGWMNHFYIYQDLEGTIPPGVTSAEVDKIRLGLENLNAGLSLEVPDDCGPAFHPMGPDTQNGVPGDPAVPNDCGGFSNGNLLTFSTDHGTVVYTQMKVLENLPVMLTSPRIWEALGLPLTPFEDTIDFFSDPGLVDEDSVRPFVAMKAQLHNFDSGAPGGVGTPVFDGGNPVIGFGTAPIDIPNCERCHSELQATSQNSAQQIGGRNPDIAALVQEEMDYWNGLYGLTPGVDSDWYSRLKGAAISILAIHDAQHGTSFTANYPATDTNPLNLPVEKLAFVQNTRLGHESVICQKCHADNVIAVVKSATCAPGNALCSSEGALIVPITEAIHDNHRNVSDGGVIVMADSQGRDGGCQGCHPAHRSDGDMAGYPITIEGDNEYALVDNRDANGGCFVGRDVHSNPGKDSDGAETPEHLNAVGQWLSGNVYNDGNSVNGGLWCTNCHQQLGQELWKAENMISLVHNEAICSAGLVGDSCNVDADCDDSVNAIAGFCGNIRGRDLQGIADVVAGGSIDQVIAWLDPKADNPLGDTTHAIWDGDPGLCNYVAGYFGVIPVDTAHDGNVATVEVNVTSAEACSTGGGTGLINCGAEYAGAPAFHICGTLDVDDDFSVNAMDFCTTPDCVAAAQATLGDPAVTGSVAVPVPFSAATDGRDHWLSAGEPHCADCHAAPYTEQSGNINAFPPFNYPRKASLMRYSRGHQDITCQGCHESIHGLYPVTPTIDTTSYAQAANLNADGSHGPVNCGACHASDGEGIPTWIRNNPDSGSLTSITDYDSAIGWAHTYTDENSVLTSTCLNCHGVQGDNWSDVAVGNESYMEHASKGNNKDLPRGMMDKAEIELYGAVFGTTDGSDGACQGCHGDASGDISCGDTEWKLHLTEGRVAESTYEAASIAQTGSTCGW